jgi:hypothetical protein
MKRSVLGSGLVEKKIRSEGGEKEGERRLMMVTCE